MKVNKIMRKVRGKFEEYDTIAHLCWWPNTGEGRKSAVAFLEAVDAYVRATISALKDGED